MNLKESRDGWRDKGEGEKCNYTFISKKLMRTKRDKQMTESLDPVSWRQVKYLEVWNKGRK